MLDVGRIHRKTLDQNLAGFGGLFRERLDVGPGPLGINVVGSDRRNAAPIVDARGDKLLKRTGRRFGGA